MNEHPILGQVVLGYSPMIDRQRTVMATRLTVFPVRPDQALDAAALLQALAEAWPADGKASLVLNLASEGLLRDSLSGEPPLNFALEVPAFMAGDAQHEAALVALHARGSTLYLKGRPSTELPRTVLACFKHSIIEFADDRRGPEAPGGPPRGAGFVQSGVSRASEVEESFQRGAVAVLGWPIDEPVGKGNGKTVAPDLKVIVELMNRVDRAGVDRPARGGAEERPDAGLPAGALHQLGGLRAARGDQLLPPRHHDAGLPEAQALAGAAAGLGQHRREHEAGDVRRGAPRPVHGRAGALVPATSRWAARCSSAACSRCSTS